MKIGVAIPSYREGDEKNYRERISQFARLAEDLGFSSIWSIDHILRTPTPSGTGLTWLAPFPCLAYLSSLTSLPLGTFYCGALRNPVLAAKDLAALLYLHDERVILGSVIGWNPHEHEAVGSKMRERGRRTDEWLHAVELLLTTEGASFEGDYYRFRDVTIDPMPRRRPPIWVGGGSGEEHFRAAIGASHGEETAGDPVPPKLLERILRYDGWVVSGQARPSTAARSWTFIAQSALDRGRNPGSIMVSLSAPLHLVETTDRAEALAIQRPYWQADISVAAEPMEQAFLVGTVDDVIEGLRLRASVYNLGEIVAAAPQISEAEHQLELWAKHLLPAVADL